MSRINKDPKLLKEHIQDMYNDGWQKATFKDVKPSEQIRYVRKMEKGPNKFISGGIVVAKESDYLVYRGGPRLWSLQASDIILLWSRPKQKKAKKQNIIRLKIGTGNFKVEHNGQVIYAGKQQRDADNFKNTQKYKRIISGAEYEVI